MQALDIYTDYLNEPPRELRVPSLRLVLDDDADEVRIDGEVVECPPRARRLLAHLLRHPQRVVSKQELLEQAWEGVHVCESSLHEAVSLLRRSLSPVDPTRRALATVRGRGYRWRAPVDTH